MPQRWLQRSPRAGLHALLVVPEDAGRAILAASATGVTEPTNGLSQIWKTANLAAAAFSEQAGYLSVLPALIGLIIMVFAGLFVAVALGILVLAKVVLWVLLGTSFAVLSLSWFFGRTLAGKAMRATAINAQAAQLMGVSTRVVMRASYALAALLGAFGGVLIAPIAFTSYDAGVMLGLKGFAAAMLGGLGSFGGAVAGGLLLGLLEAFGAGFVSSAYKDAIAFVVILAVLFFMPGGLAGARGSERV